MYTQKEVLLKSVELVPIPSMMFALSDITPPPFQWTFTPKQIFLVFYHYCPTFGVCLYSLMLESPNGPDPIIQFACNGPHRSNFRSPCNSLTKLSVLEKSVGGSGPHTHFCTAPPTPGDSPLLGGEGEGITRTPHSSQWHSSHRGSPTGTS